MELPDPLLAALHEFDHEFVDWCQSSIQVDLQPPCPSSHASYSSVLKLSDIASALPDFSRSAPSIPHSGPLQLKRPHALAFMDSLTQNLEILSEPEDIKPLLDPTPVPLCTEDCAVACKRPKLSLDFESSDVHPKPNVSKEILSQRELHIRSERLRRRSMTESFTTLQSLIPKLKLKHTDRITVLTEVIAYIESLRGSLDELECKKSDIMALLGFRPEDYLTDRYFNNDIPVKRNPGNVLDDGESTVEVTVRLSGRDVFITLTLPKHKGIWSRILMFLQRCSIDVVSATLTTSRDNNFHCIHGKILPNSELESTDLHARLEHFIVTEMRTRSKW